MVIVTAEVADLLSAIGLGISAEPIIGVAINVEEATGITVLTTGML